jgi:hypothetical protein
MKVTAGRSVVVSVHISTSRITFQVKGNTTYALMTA